MSTTIPVLPDTIITLIFDYIVDVGSKLSIHPDIQRVVCDECLCYCKRAGSLKCPIKHHLYTQIGNCRYIGRLSRDDVVRIMYHNETPESVVGMMVYGGVVLAPNLKYLHYRCGFYDTEALNKSLAVQTQLCVLKIMLVDNPIIIPKTVEELHIDVCRCQLYLFGGLKKLYLGTYNGDLNVPSTVTHLHLLSYNSPIRLHPELVELNLESYTLDLPDLSKFLQLRVLKLIKYVKKINLPPNLHTLELGKYNKPLDFSGTKITHLVLGQYNIKNLRLPLHAKYITLSSYTHFGLQIPLSCVYFNAPAYEYEYYMANENRMSTQCVYPFILEYLEFV